MATRKKAKPSAAREARSPDPDRIDRLTIAGFKSIVQETIELGRLNVFIGENGSGKTAVLEAIGLLGAAAIGRVDAGELMRRGVRPSAPRLFTTALGKKPAETIQLEAQSAAGASYSVTLVPPRGEDWPNIWRFKTEKVAIGHEELFRRSDTVAEVRAPHGRWRSIPTFGPGLGSAAQAIPLAGDALRELLFSLTDAVIYDPKTPALRGMAPDPFQREPLGLHGGGLAHAIKTLRTEEGGLGPLARDELLALIGWAGDVNVGRPDLDVASPEVPMTSEIIRFVDPRMTPGREQISAFDASEGALYVLFALALLFHPHTPRLFGVEGLDHALHPRLARALMRMLGDHVSTIKKQIVLTTHNPLVLDGLALANDDIRLFTVERTGTGRTVVSRVEYTEALRKAEKSGATLSQMWVRGLLGAVPDIW